jgi:hypothetical protein
MLWGGRLIFVGMSDGFPRTRRNEGHIDPRGPLRGSVAPRGADRWSTDDGRGRVEVMPWDRIPGSPPLGDDLFLVGHSDRTGCSRLTSRALGIGLVAALLGELVLSGHVAVSGREVRITDPSPPGDGISRALLRHLRRTPGHDLHTWLGLLGPWALETVGGRVAGAGWGRCVRRRRGLRRRTLFHPTDPGEVYWRSVRVGQMITGNELPGRQDVLLIGLIEAVGLLDQVVVDDPVGAARRIRRVVGMAGPSIQGVLCAVHTVVGDGVLAVRG